MEERIRNSNHLFFTNDAFVYDDNNRFEISQPADVPKVIFSQEDGEYCQG